MPAFAVIHAAAPGRNFVTLSPKVNEKTHLVLLKASRSIDCHVCRTGHGGTNCSVAAFGTLAVYRFSVGTAGELAGNVSPSVDKPFDDRIVTGRSPPGGSIRRPDCVAEFQ
jgi:hypothetical protein